jgi:hypothetical protein
MKASIAGFAAARKLRVGWICRRYVRSAKKRLKLRRILSISIQTQGFAMKTAIFASVVLLSGCATCERHPIGCGAAVGILATSIALSVNQHHDRTSAMAPATATIQPPNCASNPASCQ